jgi:hypothetical protein
MKSMAWVLFGLIVTGVVYYGLARAVVLGVLTMGVFSIFAFFACGITHEVLKAKARKPDPQNPSADEFRQMKAVQEPVRELVQAAALATVKPADPELRHLRRMAGLE